jgi:hypothetical protein
MSIKKVDSVSHLNETATFVKDCGMFEVRSEVEASLAPIHSEIVENGVWTIDVQDVCINFYINGEKAKWAGFKTLYAELFSEEAFDKFLKNTYEEMEEFYLHSTKYSTVEDLTENQQLRMLKDLVRDSQKLLNNGAEYTSDWKVIQVAKALGFETPSHLVPSTRTGRKFQHAVFYTHNL